MSAEIRVKIPFYIYLQLFAKFMEQKNVIHFHSFTYPSFVEKFMFYIVNYFRISQNNRKTLSILHIIITNKNYRLSINKGKKKKKHQNLFRYYLVKESNAKIPKILQLNFQILYPIIIFYSPKQHL